MIIRMRAQLIGGSMLLALLCSSLSAPVCAQNEDKGHWGDPAAMEPLAMLGNQLPEAVSEMGSVVSRVLHEPLLLFLVLFCVTGVLSLGLLWLARVGDTDRRRASGGRYQSAAAGSAEGGMERAEQLADGQPAPAEEGTEAAAEDAEPPLSETEHWQALLNRARVFMEMPERRQEAGRLLRELAAGAGPAEAEEARQLLSQMGAD